MIESLRPIYNRTLRPGARFCLMLGIHPNMVTVVGLLLFIAAGYAVARGFWVGAFVLVLVGSLMDGLDGVLAREGGTSSRFGAVLDSSCDRLTEMALFGGLMFFYQHASLYSRYMPLLSFTALCSAVMISYVKARCEGVGIVCNRGILQRPERLILLCVGLLLGPTGMAVILLLIVVLGFGTVIQRLVQAAQ